MFFWWSRNSFFPNQILVRLAAIEPSPGDVPPWRWRSHGSCDGSHCGDWDFEFAERRHGCGGSQRGQDDCDSDHPSAQTPQSVLQLWYLSRGQGIEVKTLMGEILWNPLSFPIWEWLCLPIFQVLWMDTFPNCLGRQTSNFPNPSGKTIFTAVDFPNCMGRQILRCSATVRTNH